MRAEDPAPGTHSLVLCHRNRRSKLPTPEQQRTLPLHAKAVEKLNMEYLYQHVLSPSAAARVKHLLSCLNYDPRAPAELPRPMFRMPAAHAKRMCDIGVFEDLGKVEDLDLSQYNSMNYFTVHEVRDAGDRLRPICWPLALLLLSQYRSQHRLKTVDDYRRLALLGGTAATFDLAASFWQVPLPKESKLVCVTDDGRVVRMTRLPYGADVASEVMHIITSALAGDPLYCKCAGEAGIPASSFSRDCAVHIDNVFFGGPHGAKRASLFLERCKRANAQLNKEEGNTFSTRQKFVGLKIDLEQGTVCLKDGFAKDIITGNSIRTCEDLERAMGKLLYGGAVLGVDWRAYLFLIKQYRRTLSVCARDDKEWTREFKFWRVARQQFEALLAIVRANQPVKVLPKVIDQEIDDPDYIVATDATPTSFGGLLPKPGCLPQAFGANFPERIDDINLAESVAAACVLQRFAEEIGSNRPGQRQSKVLLLVDNTSAISRIANTDKHGRLDVDGVAPALRALAAKHGFSICVQYIRSQENPADAVSRMREPDMKLVDDVLTRARGRFEQRATLRACGRRAAAPVTR